MRRILKSITGFIICLLIAFSTAACTSHTSVKENNMTQSEKEQIKSEIKEELKQEIMDELNSGKQAQPGMEQPDSDDVPTSKTEPMTGGGDRTPVSIDSGENVRF